MEEMNGHRDEQVGSSVGIDHVYHVQKDCSTSNVNEWPIWFEKVNDDKAYYES